MRARLVPLLLGPVAEPPFEAQLAHLEELLADEAEILRPVALGTQLPEADAAVLPQVTSDIYPRATEIGGLGLPVLVLTSQFGGMSMWDWEAVSYLRSQGASVAAPYSLDHAKVACRALAAKRELRNGHFLVYQDQPGESGQQPEIFRRFYWWQGECADRLQAKFGVQVVKRSFRELASRARRVPEQAALGAMEGSSQPVPMPGVAPPAKLAALQLYRAVCQDLDDDPLVLAAGINCLNESAFSETTPCLAWDILWHERGLIWGCEADLVSMLTEFIVHRSLRAPFVMTNLYPFLLGKEALAHERMPAFPEVEDPDNYVLAAHCGYLGVVPRAFATEWALRPKVLAIVDDNATAIDARLPEGPVTLSKLAPTFETFVAVGAELTGYAGYAGSDCRNGALVRVPDGRTLVDRLPSHHSILSVGHDPAGLRLVCATFGLELENLGDPTRPSHPTQRREEISQS